VSGRPCPTLTTARLVLSAHRTGDFEDVLTMWSDPVVTRYMGGPAGPDQAWDRLIRYAGLWTLFGYGFWRIGERETGRYVGDIGLMEMRRDLQPSFFGTPEAGWSLAPWAQGRGFAREAAGAMLGWADATLAERRTVCMIHPDNIPSLTLAARLGYRPYGRTTYKERPLVLLERPVGHSRQI
jgi:RimJ/RimL family protein N-acetyltransferase